MKSLKHLLLIGILFIVLPSASTCQPDLSPVKTGLEVLIERDFDILRDKRVGLITNPTGVDRQLRSTIDIFHESERVKLVALFGPEHGVRGQYPAGEKINTSIDPKTGLPIHSLYGKTRKPTPDMLKGIDVLVYDIQDIGLRSYTFISTMGLAMEAAAEAGIAFVVLDRPNPLGGLKIEGPVAEEELFSFVGAYPIPYIYGLSCGELARMINGEGWLKNGLRCQLTVIPMQGWTRDMPFMKTKLPWVPPSPHIPHPETAAFAAATGILGELGVVNIGVGYTLPFELMATEFLDPALIASEMNEFYGGKVLFRPLSFKAYYGKEKDKTLNGLHIYLQEPESVSLLSIQFKFLEILHKHYPSYDIAELSNDRHQMFDKVCGTKEVRELFFRTYQLEDLSYLFQKGVAAFKASSSLYYLYP